MLPAGGRRQRNLARRAELLRRNIAGRKDVENPGFPTPRSPEDQWQYNSQGCVIYVPPVRGAIAAASPQITAAISGETVVSRLQLRSVTP